MVTLRPILATDAPAVAAAVDESRDALRRWMVWYRDDYDAHAASAWIADALAKAAAGTAVQFAILTTDDKLVGVIGLEDIDEESGRAMIGYWLSTRVAGRGIGRNAVKLAVAWARTRPEINVIWAVVADANLASRRVLESNQFHLVGTRDADEGGDTALLYEVELYAPTA
jgi:RimJ/RimL family protein N-acetyltransferase